MTAEQPGPAACSYRIILSSEFASNTLVHSTPGYIHDSSAQFSVVVAAASVCSSHNDTCGTQPTNRREHHICAWVTQKEAVQQAALLTLDALHHTWATWPHAVLNMLYCVFRQPYRPCQWCFLLWAIHASRADMHGQLQCWIGRQSVQSLCTLCYLPGQWHMASCHWGLVSTDHNILPCQVPCCELPALYQC
jgi:hypothetical protein